jgi:sulfur-oxidizing protein SoxX
MRKTARLVTTASALATVLGALSLSPQLAIAADAQVIEEGKKIAFDRKKGNCLACHQIEGGDLAGNIGPPLVAMKARFPDKSKLRAQIWDSTKNNPNTMMPPFGRHEILTESEIDKVVECVYSL